MIKGNLPELMLLGTCKTAVRSRPATLILIAVSPAFREPPLVPLLLPLLLLVVVIPLLLLVVIPLLLPLELALPLLSPPELELPFSPLLLSPLELEEPSSEGGVLVLSDEQAQTSESETPSARSEVVNFCIPRGYLRAWFWAIVSP
jgi:hypothetical protein